MIVACIDVSSDSWLARRAADRSGVPHAKKLKIKQEAGCVVGHLRGYQADHMKQDSGLPDSGLRLLCRRLLHSR